MATKETAAEPMKLTRNEMATARANARLWATSEFQRIARDLRARGLNAAQTQVYLSELTGYLRYVDPTIVESA